MARSRAQDHFKCYKTVALIGRFRPMVDMIGIVIIVAIVNVYGFCRYCFAIVLSSSQIYCRPLKSNSQKPASRPRPIHVQIRLPNKSRRKKVKMFEPVKQRV